MNRLLRTRRRAISTLISAGCSALVWSVGCGPTGAASQMATPPKFEPEGQTKCSVAKSRGRPLIVEWPAADRAALESQARRGIVVVRYKGCELEVLRQCKAAGDYAYVALTPKEERVAIRDEDELYASIPVYAAKFEGQLQRSGQLSVNMTIVGMYEARTRGGAGENLEGDCDGATHVITALAVGSFEFFAGADAVAGGGASALGAEAGARSASHRETLSRDGSTESCARATRGDAEPPASCGALLRLEVAPIGSDLLSTDSATEDTKTAGAPAQPQSVQCPAGQRPRGDGKGCEPAPKESSLAPEDAGFVDSRGGFEWGNRCFLHVRAGRIANARAACNKGLAMSPEPDIRGAILFNLALAEEADGDVAAACSYLESSLLSRDSGPVRRKKEALGCGK